MSRFLETVPTTTRVLAMATIELIADSLAPHTARSAAGASPTLTLG